MKYSPPKWLPGGHLQTIWPALYSRRAVGALPQYTRERWATPDADFVDVDWLQPMQNAKRKRPLLVMFHGLEGSSRSHYSESFADYAVQRRWAFAVPHFRGCSGELNLAERSYHSGDFEEVAWILQRFRQQHAGPIFAVGISMGGNALLRWAEEMGAVAQNTVSAVAAVCSPVDLAASGHAIGQGFNRQTYTRMFLKSMVPKALEKLRQHPGLFNREAMLRVRDLYAFDNVFTAPLHGYKDAQDYWSRASAKPQLHAIRIPALVVNALNDPFVPAWSLPIQEAVGSAVTLWQPQGGGHVGFAQGKMPGHVQAMPQAVGEWLARHVEEGGASDG
jgi:uncharacterized protein